jgi:hypothetical protein
MAEQKDLAQEMAGLVDLEELLQEETAIIPAAQAEMVLRKVGPVHRVVVAVVQQVPEALVGMGVVPILVVQAP